MSKEIHELKQAGEAFYPKTISDAVEVGNQTLTEVLADINSGGGINFDALVEMLDDRFLSKITADQASEVITFLKGVKCNAQSTFNNGIKDGGFVSSSSGWSIGYDESGNSIMEVDKLLVRMEAIFRELVIEKLSHVGGARVISPAAMTCSGVEEFDGFYRCYFDRGENGEVVQQFEVDDQARCQAFDGNGMKYYWRLVVGVGDDYIDLSKSDCDGSNTPTLTTIWSHTDVPSAENARDAVGVNKVIYVKRAAGRLVKYDKYGLTEELYDDTQGISVTNDTAGNIIMNNYPYQGTDYSKPLKVLDVNGEYHTILFSLPEKAIAQYLSPISGNILSGAATIYLWCSGRDYIYKVNLMNGEQVDVNFIDTDTTGDYTSEAYAVGGDIVTHTRGNGYIAINDGAGNETILTANTINNTAGSVTFAMGGTSYIVYNSGVNYADGFTIAELYTGAVMAVHEPLTNPTAAVNNSYSNRLSVQVINETRAYIYCYTPGAMIAMYLFAVAEGPAAGDDIVLCGNRSNVDRQNCIIETSYGDVSYIQYAGINSYSLAGKEVTVLSPRGNKFVGSFEFSSGADVSSAISSVANNIAALNTDIAGVNETILAQGTRINATESAIALQAAKITAAEGAITTHSSEISQNAAGISLRATEIAALETSLSEITIKANEIELKVDTLDDDLLATGIDIENQSIIVTADKFKIRNNDGEETFTVFEDGKIKSELIETGQITSKKVKTSNSGKRVEIDDDKLTAYNSDGDIKLLVSGDNLGDAESSTANIQILSVEDGGSGESWDVEKELLAEYTITGSNNIVTIPAITIETTLSGAGTGYLDNLIVTIFINDEEYYSEGLNGTSVTIPSRSQPMSAGDYVLSYSVKGRGESTASYSVDISASGNIVIEYTKEILQLSANGFRGIFGSSGIEVMSDKIILSQGSFRIRLSSLGIQKSIDSGSTWNSL